MAELTIIYWRDIPAQIIVRAGRKNAKRELPARFQEAIDRAAMHAGAKDSDAYLSAWRRGEPALCGEALEDEAESGLRRVEADYDGERLKRLIASGGFETVSTPSDPLVLFQPSGKRGRFPPGTPLLTAARALGVDLDSVCGGRGMCGRCQVEIQTGSDAKLGITSLPAHVSATEAVEQRYADKRELGSKRLGCQATILGDLIVDVPASSQLHRQIVRKEAVARPIELDPVVVPRFVELPPATLESAASDFDRLRSALKAQWGVEVVAFSPLLLSSLQTRLREGNWQVTLAIRDGRDVVAIYPGLKTQLAGIAIDIGSTTIAAHLCDLSDGAILASAGMMNPQIRFGEDLMSRVSYAMMHENGADEMARTVRGAVNELIANLVTQAGLQREDVVEIVIVGNPVMHHLVLGIDPRELGTAPFALAVSEAVDIPAALLGLAVAPGAYVHLLPCIAGHVGADASAMVLAEAPQDEDEIVLLVDVGTNAEIVLGNRERLLACSSPTGPALEGAQLSSGQRAAPGAIERIAIEPQTFEPRFKVIGVEPWSDEPGFAEETQRTGITGLCGSAIIDVVAELALAGLITPDGLFDAQKAPFCPRLLPEGRSFSYLVHDGSPRIVVTQADIRAVQLAKAALHAGCKLLMARLGIDKVSRIKLAGAFGAHIDPLHALVLGLVPDCELSRVQAVGNAAGHGARIALLNASARRSIQEVVRRIEKIETALDPLFQAEFVAAMAIPHARDAFEETARYVRLPARPVREERRRLRTTLREN